MTASAVVLQYMMWKQAKRQNDLLSKPRLRLKSRIADIEAVDRSTVQKTRRRSVVHELYHTDVESEWQSHIQATEANLGAIPNSHVGFIVENIGGVIATGFKLKVEITISGNPKDQTVTSKTYNEEHSVEIDVQPGGRIFVALLHTRLIFDVAIVGHIVIVRDSLGIEEAFKAKNQQTATVLFKNEALRKALSAPPPKPTDEYDPFSPA